MRGMWWALLLNLITSIHQTTAPTGPTQVDYLCVAGGAGGGGANASGNSYAGGGGGAGGFRTATNLSIGSSFDPA